jgi:hypothetical protein
MMVVVVVRWEGRVACMEDERNAYRVLVGKPEGKKLLAGRRHKWENDSKIYL